MLYKTFFRKFIHSIKNFNGNESYFNNSKSIQPNSLKINGIQQNKLNKNNTNTSTSNPKDMYSNISEYWDLNNMCIVWVEKPASYRSDILRIFHSKDGSYLEAKRGSYFPKTFCVFDIHKLDCSNYISIRDISYQLHLSNLENESVETRQILCYINITNTHTTKSQNKQNINTSKYPNTKILNIFNVYESYLKDKIHIPFVKNNIKIFIVIVLNSIKTSSTNENSPSNSEYTNTNNDSSKETQVNRGYVNSNNNGSSDMENSDNNDDNNNNNEKNNYDKDANEETDSNEESSEDGEEVIEEDISDESHEVEEEIDLELNNETPIEEPSFLIQNDNVELSQTTCYTELFGNDQTRETNIIEAEDDIIESFQIESEQSNMEKANEINNTINQMDVNRFIETNGNESKQIIRRISESLIQIDNREEDTTEYQLIEVNKSYYKGKHPCYHVEYNNSQYWICKICCSTFRSDQSFYNHIKDSYIENIPSSIVKQLVLLFDQSMEMKIHAQKNINLMLNNQKCIPMNEICTQTAQMFQITRSRSNVSSNSEISIENPINEEIIQENVTLFPKDNEYQYYFTKDNIRKEKQINIFEFESRLLNLNIEDVKTFLEQIHFSDTEGILKIILENMNNNDKQNLLSNENEDKKPKTKEYYKKFTKEEIEEYTHDFIELLNKNSNYSTLNDKEKSTFLMLKSERNGTINIEQYIYYLILCKTTSNTNLFKQMIKHGLKSVMAKCKLSKLQSKLMNKFLKLLFHHVYDTTVALSYETIVRHKEEEMKYNEMMLNKLLKESIRLSIALDESNKRRNDYFGCFIRFTGNRFIADVPLFLKRLKATGKGFGEQLTQQLFETINILNMNKCKLSSVCCDGDASMIGHLTGFVSEIEKKLIDEKHCKIFQSNHCMLHRLQLVLTDLKADHVFKTFNSFIETLCEDTHRRKYEQFLENLIDQCEDVDKKKRRRNYSKIPELSPTRFSFCSNTFTVITKQYNEIASFVKDNKDFWRDFSKKMMKKINAKEEITFNNETMIVVPDDNELVDEEWSDDDNVILTPQCSTKIQKLETYLDRKFNMGSEFLRINEGKCNIQIKQFKQCFIMSAYLTKLVHSIAQYFQNKNIIITEFFEIIIAVEEKMISIYQQEGNMFKDEWIECSLFNSLKGSFNVDEYDISIGRDLFNRIIGKFIKGLKTRFVTIFHQYNVKRSDQLTIKEPFFNVEDNIYQYGELKRSGLGNYLRIFYYPHFCMIRKELDIPKEMFELIKDELEAVDLVILHKGEEILQQKTEKQNYLQKFLECEIYISLIDITKYLQPEQFPGIYEVISMVVSIQPSTALVESMFSVSSSYHKPNISTEKLSLDTMFSLKNHISIRNL